MELNGIYTAETINLFKGMIPQGERDEDHFLTVQSFMNRLTTLSMLAALSPRETHGDKEDWIHAPLNMAHIRQLLQECESTHPGPCRSQRVAPPHGIMAINVREKCLERH